MLSKLYYAEPFYYAMSNTLTMLDRNGNNIDSGAEPDVELVTETADGGTDYTDCYDIEIVDTTRKDLVVTIAIICDNLIASMNKD